MSVTKIVVWQNEETMSAVGGFMREFNEVVLFLAKKGGCEEVGLPQVEPFALRNLIEILAGEQQHGVERSEALAMASLAPSDKALHVLMAYGERARTLVIRAARALRDDRPWDAFCAVLMEQEDGQVRFRPLDSFRMATIISRQEQDERETHDAALEACEGIIDSARTIQPGETWANDLMALGDEIPCEGELED